MATATDNRARVTGVLAEKADDQIVLTLPGTDYRLHLLIGASSDGLAGYQQGARISGVIRASAKRVDVIRSGGRYIEPVYGRPRRLQGRIISRDANANTLTVQTCCPVTCKLMPPQNAGRFDIGQLVSFDVERGAWFDVVDDA